MAVPGAAHYTSIGSQDVQVEVYVDDVEVEDVKVEDIGVEDIEAEDVVTLVSLVIHVPS